MNDQEVEEEKATKKKEKAKSVAGEVENRRLSGGRRLRYSEGWYGYSNQ